MNKQFKNRMRFYDPVYVTNGDATICQMMVNMQLDQSSIYGLIDQKVLDKFKVDSNGCFVVRAVTKRRGDDKLDPIVGKRVAESKAKVKAYSKAGRIINELINSAFRQISHAVRYQNQLTGCYDREVKHVKDLSDF